MAAPSAERKPHNMRRDQWWSAWAFLTRLPCPSHRPQRLGTSAWAMPLVGAAVGLIGALIMGAADWAGIGPLAAAALAVAAIVLATGALHEDGLADTADAFGLPRSAEETHRILKDSRIGTFGVLALVFAVLLRVLLAAEAGPWSLVYAEASGRAAIAVAMACAVPSGAGTAIAAGKAATGTALFAIATAAVLCVVLGGARCLAGQVLAALAVAALMLISAKRIGGYTGDVLGAAQQVSVIAVLLAAAVSE